MTEPACPTCHRRMTISPKVLDTLRHIPATGGRYSAILRLSGTVPHSTLQNRLARLMRAGLVERRMVDDNWTYFRK